MSYIKEFLNVSESLDQSYNSLLNSLKKIIVLTDQLFINQIDETNGVYSKNIKDRLTKHPEYKTSPYTFTYIKSGEITETSYHKFLKTELKPILKELENTKLAIEIISDKNLDKQWWKEYLDIVKRGFESDSWDEVEKKFLSLPENSPLFLSIGPIDSYHDKLLGAKKFFSAWVLIKDTEQQINAKKLWYQLQTIDSKNDTKIKLYIGKLFIAGGEVAKHNSMGWSRPENPAILETYGGIKAIATNQLLLHTEKMGKAIQDAIIKWGIEPNIGKQVIQFHQNESIIPLLLHEYGHTFQKDEIFKINLGKYYDQLEETRANTNMLYLAANLEQTGELPNFTTQNIFLRVLFYLSYLYEEFTVRNQREEYLYAALVWLKNAEELKIVSINESRLSIDTFNLNTKLNLLTNNILIQIRTASQTKDLHALQKDKKEIFHYGEIVAEKLHIK